MYRLIDLFNELFRLLDRREINRYIQIDRQIEKQIVRYMDIDRYMATGQIDIWINIYMDRQIHGYIYSWIDIYMDRYIHGQIERQIDIKELT